MQINEIKPYPKNAKKHDKKQIQGVANSIKRFGFVQPIVIDKNNEVVIGHCRLEAAKVLGLQEVPTISVENLTDEEVKALRLADNKLNESEWDMALAIEELKGLSDEMFDLTGFDKDLLIEPDEKDDVIPDNAPTVAKLGDIWALGGHRVKCGDSTSPEAISELMGGSQAKMCFTSPPYNMANKTYYNEYKDNLASEEYVDFNLKVIHNISNYIKGFLYWNISYNKKSRKEWIEIFYRIIKETKFRILETIVWDKGHGMPITQRNALTRQYESILLADDADGEKEIDRCFVGENDEECIFNKKTQKKLTNYWRITTYKSQSIGANNNACFPVALPTKAIMISSSEKDIVIDPFLGLGTTLIACEKTNRICYGMELDPKYVDVIIKRWEDYAGQKAIKLS